MKQSCYGEIDKENKMIDFIFNLLINKSEKISKDFYNLIDRLELDYKKEMLDTMKQEKVNMIKEIIYILYELYIEKFNDVLVRIKRDELFSLYDLCKNYKTDDFIAYYKKAIINKYLNTS